jgi:hypothetical protein
VEVDPTVAEAAAVAVIVAPPSRQAAVETVTTAVQVEGTAK